MSSQALDLYVKFGENTGAPGGSEKWALAKSVHLPASPAWQTVEIPLEGLVEEGNYQGDKDWKKLGNGRLDLDSLQRVEIFVNKGEKQEAELFVDDLEFK